MKQTTLLESGTSFLIESIENYESGKLAFAILHAVIATELLLKERLEQIHPNLIYSKIDSKNIEHEKTVGLGCLPHRLKNMGVTLENNETSLISAMRKWRNQIVHHMPQYDDKEARDKLSRLFNFVANFLKRELNQELRKILPVKMYRTANKLIKDWQLEIKEAQKKSKEEGNVLEEICPVCNTGGTITLREEDEAFCHLCETKLHYGDCSLCGGRVLGIYSEEMYHNKCLDEIGDMYNQQQLDIAKGK